MAITSAVCNSFKTEVLQALHNFTASSGNSFKLALYTSSATLNKSTTAYSATNEISNTSDLWMGPLYRKRSLRIWEIPESEWLSTDPIPINQMNDRNKDPILIGIDEKE